MTETFSFTSSIASSWKVFKTHFKFIVPAIIASAAIMMLFQVLQNNTEHRPILSFIVVVVSTVVSIAVSLGWSHVILKLIRYGSAAWTDFQTNTRTWLHYFVARVLYGFCVLFGFVMIVVPLFMIVILSIHVVWFIIVGSIISLAGLILVSWLMTRYMFISLIAIDHPGMNGWKILKESAKMTKGSILKLFGFLLLVLLINIVGILVAFVGLLVTIPVTMIASGYVYEYLKKKNA